MPNLNPLISTLCPVCHFTLAAPFFDGGSQPIATLGWPNSQEQARLMTCLPLNYVQCPRCTHVWNRSFTYEDIPYKESPNQMFNKGAIWLGHLAKTRDLILSDLPIAPTVIDIGCGEGHFVRGIANAREGRGRFVGFDPSPIQNIGQDIELHSRYFEPIQDIVNLAPDLLVMRHVLEHLTDCAAFVEQLAWGASQLDKRVLFFAEMPCIDRVFDSKRLSDFFYEHPSQFTTRSFKTLMERSGTILELAHGYDGEVVYALVELGLPESYQATLNSSLAFYDEAFSSQAFIRKQLEELIEQGQSVAIWGGTGKSAAFINFFQAVVQNFPIVIDSDFQKVGTYVPGTGQIIQFRDVLKANPVDVIIIPPQWRAKDIVAEMRRENIMANKILIEHGGKLIDFLKAEHPYA